MSVETWGEEYAAPDLALAIYRAPARYAALLHGKDVLPGETGQIMRRAAEAVRLGSEAALTDSDRAALFFVEHILLSAEADHYRVLGLERGADDEAIRDRYRLLMRILHPDRCGWLGLDAEGLAARVNKAHDTLRNPRRRADYDLGLRQAVIAGAAPRTTPRPRRARARPSAAREPLLSKFPHVVQRHVPQFVLGTVAMIGALFVFGAYLSGPPAGAIGGGPSIRQAELARLGWNEPSEEPPRPSDDAPAQAASGTPDEAQPPAAAAPAAELAPPASDPPHRAIATAAPRDRAAAPDRGPAPKLAPEARRAAERVPLAAAPREASPAVSDSAQLRRASATAVRDPQASEAAAPSAAMAEDLAEPSMRPASAGAVNVPPERVAPLARLEADDLLRQFVECYQAGDIERFMALFAADARASSGDRATIRRDYAALFAESSRRQIELPRVDWLLADDTGRGEAKFAIHVTRDGKEQAIAGTLRMEVVKSGGRALIAGLYHRETAVETPRLARLASTATPAPTALPAAANPEVAPRPEPPVETGLTREEASALLERLVVSYGAGELESFMALFAPDARTGSGDRSAISKDYEKLFGSTGERRLKLRNVVWQLNGDSGQATGEFLLRLTRDGETQERVFVGTIQIEIVRQGGRTLIRKLTHETT